MGLVSVDELTKIAKADRFGPLGNVVGWLLMKVMRIDRINAIYDKHKDKKELEFLNAILDEIGIQYDIPEEDLKRIPKDGAFITVSNHPLGGIDGILLLKFMLEIRLDYKIIANFLLQRILPMKPYIMPVNPFENHKDAKSSIAGVKNALLHLKEGHPLGIFPAGEVSTMKNGQMVFDKPWEVGAIKLIKKAKVPIVPIYFHAKNSKLFYWISRRSETLRSARLPSEFLSQKERVIRVRIGRPISVKEQQNYTTYQDFHNFIRKKTYMLANPYVEETPIFSKPSLRFPKSPKEIIEPVSSAKIEVEIEKLIKKGARLFETKNYHVFFSDSSDIEHILMEIGRLREVTFREVGEGTNNAFDLDDYDAYYKHLFLWDSEAKQIVGAYRMGFGKEIFSKYGVEGFYVNELFRIEPELYPMLKRTIEMGRAFIIKAYQQKPMPLFLLWRGIVHITLRYPDHKYLMGGVSISNKFSNFSKSLMIEFMRSHYYDPYVAQYVHPKMEYKVKLEDADKDFVFDETKADLNKFDRLIDEIEPGNLRLPVLIKKYVKQNAKLVAFNVDPKFNNAIDGLMYIRIADLPESTVKPVMEELQAQIEQNLQQENTATKASKSES